MDLVIATIQLAAVIDIRSLQPEHAAETSRTSQRNLGAWSEHAVFQTGVRLRAGNGLAQRHVPSRRRSACELVDADAVTIRGQVLHALGTGATGFAVVFDVHAEGTALPSATAIGHGVIAHAREADLVRGSAARLWPAKTVARIAETA